MWYPCRENLDPKDQLDPQDPEECQWVDLFSACTGNLFKQDFFYQQCYFSSLTGVKRWYWPHRCCWICRNPCKQLFTVLVSTVSYPAISFQRVSVFFWFHLRFIGSWWPTWSEGRGWRTRSERRCWIIRAPRLGWCSWTSCEYKYTPKTLVVILLAAILECNSQWHPICHPSFCCHVMTQDKVKHS